MRIDDGIYRLSWVDRILRTYVRELDDVWEPVPGNEGEEPSDNALRRFGWVMGGLPAPSKGDRYIVEFVDDRAEAGAKDAADAGAKSAADVGAKGAADAGAKSARAAVSFRVLAYMDRFGRVFSTDRAIEAPPAREPDLAFARFEEASTDKVETGCVQVRFAHGGAKQMVQYRKETELYSLFDTWYDFNGYTEKQSYADVLARCYVAFVFRPSQGARAVPVRDFALINNALKDMAPLSAFDFIVHEMESVRRDEALDPPVLASCLADWLEEAGSKRVVASVRKGSGPSVDPLRLVRTARYANTYYLGVNDESATAGVSVRDIWALEGALNRFLLLSEIFGKEAPTATAAECARCEEALFALASFPTLDAANTADAQGDPAGEWRVRACLGEAMERLRLPMRYAASFKVDVESGIVAFDVTAPDALLMPARVWGVRDEKWVPADLRVRQDQALRYAQRLGIMLAAAAFHSSRLITAVLVRACPLADADSADAREKAPEPFYRVLFDRELFCEEEAYRRAMEDDPAPLYAAHGALYGEQAQADPFDVVDHLGSVTVRKNAPEGLTIRFDEEAGKALGARTTHDLRVDYDGALRYVGETLADRVVASESATEAIRYVRAAQDGADDPRVVEACTRLMTALVEGSVDAADQNAVVTCFLGEDRYQRAMLQARAVAPQDLHAAISILRTVVAEVEASGKFADNAETVHRVFDSYASRVTYNLRRPEADQDKLVALAPVSLLLCYLDLVKLFEESFEHAEEALRLGYRVMEMAPTFTVAYRQTARVCMLMGDLEEASRILKRCLEFALQDDEIAIAYYQLAYVEWKAGRPLVGAACYLKSIMSSPIYAAQSTVELQELVGEEGVDMLPRELVDVTLKENGVPVAPSIDLLAQLDAAITAAVDANVFLVARSLLGARLRHRPDDAWANVQRSLAN